MKGMSGHQSAFFQSDTWLTPRYILDDLMEFDLDPCAAPDPKPWPTAKRMITLPDDGLSTPWVKTEKDGVIGDSPRVWLNPPYGSPATIGPWLRKMAKNNRGIALIFARTETAIFFETVWRAATGVLFLEGRLHFYRADGTRSRFNAGAPSCLVAYGLCDALILKGSKLPGHFVALKSKHLF